MHPAVESNPSRSVSLPALVLFAGLIVILLGVGLVLYLGRGVSTSSRAGVTLSEEQKAYLRMIEVSDARMSAAENFLGDVVTYLDAKIANNGERVVRAVELQLEFVDTLSQVVLRETVRPVSSRTSPLRPGELRAFRVSFDRMPLEWNQGPPVITPKYVGF